MSRIESRRSCARATSASATSDDATPHGVALITPSLPLVWQLNALRVDDTEAEPAVRSWPRRTSCWADVAHRKLFVHDEELGARLAPALAARAGT